MKFKIEKGVPIPGRYGETGATALFDNLKVGESLFVQDRNTIWASRYIYATKLKTPEKRFTSRVMNGGVRVWRLPDDLLV